MIRLILTSASLIEEYSPQALDLLRQSLTNNRRDDITGCLHLQSGTFYECLEGPRDKVAQTIRRMRNDARHAGMTILLSTPITAGQRLFADWQMSYASNNDLTVPQPEPGGQDYGSAVLTFLLHVHAVKRLGIAGFAEARARGLIREDGTEPPHVTPPPEIS